VIIDCDTGICLGNSHRGKGVKTHCTRCIVRNNFVCRAPESGILADYTRDCVIAHNTIHDPDSRLKRLIRLVHDNDGLLVANNLLSGPPIRSKTATGSIKLDGNVTRKRVEAFVDDRRGNLHLKQAVDGVSGAGRIVAAATTDFNKQTRSRPPDVGADKLESRD
jgi:hypothetical protein